MQCLALRQQQNICGQLASDLTQMHQNIANQVNLLQSILGVNSEQADSVFLSRHNPQNTVIVSLQDILQKQLLTVQTLSRKVNYITRNIPSSIHNLQNRGLDYQSQSSGFHNKGNQIVKSRKQHAYFLYHQYFNKMAQLNQKDNSFKEMFRIFDAANLLCEEVMMENQRQKLLMQQYQELQNQSGKHNGKIMNRREYQEETSSQVSQIGQQSFTPSKQPQNDYVQIRQSNSASLSSPLQRAHLSQSSVPVFNSQRKQKSPNRFSKPSVYGSPLQQELAKINEDNSNLQRAYMDKDKELLQLKTENEGLQIERQKNEQKISELHSLIDKLNGQIMALKANLEQNELNKNELKDQLEKQLKQKIMQLQEAIGSISKIDRDLTQQRNNKLELQEDNVLYKRELVSLNNQLKQAEMQINTLNNEITTRDLNRKQQNEFQKKRQRQLLNNNEKLNSTIEQLKIIVNSDKKKYDAEILEMSQKLREVRRLVSVQEQTQHQYQKICGKIQVLRHQLKTTKKQASSSSSSMRNLASGIEPFRSSMSPVGLKSGVLSTLPKKSYRRHGLDQDEHLEEEMSDVESKVLKKFDLINNQAIKRVKFKDQSNCKQSSKIADEQPLDFSPKLQPLLNQALTDQGVVQQAIRRLQDSNKKIQNLQSAVNILQSEKQKAYCSSDTPFSKQKYPTSTSYQNPPYLEQQTPLTPKSNMIEYFRAQIETLRQRKTNLQIYINELETEIAHLRRLAEKYSMEGDFGNSNIRKLKFQQLKQCLKRIESVANFTSQMRMTMISDQIHQVLDSSIKVILDLKEQLGVLSQERDKFEAQVQGYRQQLGTQRQSMKQKIDHRQNMVKIVQKNSKEQMDQIQMEKDEALRRLNIAQEKLRELNGQMESLKIQNMRINNENQFLRKERQKSYQRAKVDVLEQEEQSLSQRVREARDQGQLGYNVGRREGQISRQSEIQKLKEVLNQYKQDVEKQSRIISSLNGELDEIKTSKRRAEIQLKERNSLLQGQRRFGKLQYQGNLTARDQSRDNTLKQYLQKHHHTNHLRNSSQLTDSKNQGVNNIDASTKLHISSTPSNFQQSYLKDC